MRWWAIVGAVAVCGALVPTLSNSGVFGPSNPIESKARRDEAFVVAKEDPAMLAAREKGRATLGRFLAVKENPPPDARAFAVKIAVHDGGKVEWFWISKFSRDGERFRGAIDNTPRFVGNVRQNEIVSFSRTDIADWMYVQDGRMKGNFTACALLEKEEAKAREEFMRKFGMECRA